MAPEGDMEISLGIPSLELLPEREQWLGKRRAGPAALLVVSKDEEELWTSLVTSEGAQWVLADAGSALDAARAINPSLVILDLATLESAVALIRRLRADPATRAIGIAARMREPGGESALRSAGANAVLGPVHEPRAWQCRVHELLRVPQRRALRLPVRLAPWPRLHGPQGGFDGRLVNLSTHGLLLECAPELAVGAKLEVSFTLPGEDASLRAVGQVVRQAPGAWRDTSYGIKFLLLHGDAQERIAAVVEERRRAAVDQQGR
jgi:PilZ domain-containing protein